MGIFHLSLLYFCCEGQPVRLFIFRLGFLRVATSWIEVEHMHVWLDSGLGLLPRHLILVASRLDLLGLKSLSYQLCLSFFLLSGHDLRSGSILWPGSGGSTGPHHSRKHECAEDAQHEKSNFQFHFSHKNVRPKISLRLTELFCCHIPATPLDLVKLLLVFSVW